MSEEAIYGLILVSGMIVVAGSDDGRSLSVLVTVAVTVLVFYAAHVYAGALGRLAATDGSGGLGTSLRAAARQSSGMLAASVPAIIVLALGTTHVIADATANWTALVLNTIVLGALGWIAVARWTTHWAPRIISALITAAFGGALIALKALIHH
ncbi:hypothetical protein GCM10010460_00710 [Microbacterium terrae]|uniref:Uncharacterized protein n=2 Tax=Microbacterium terrae TaxID=69369 RepID=A0A0M2H7S7_9MICO|nr:hypothetical protein RS81_01819 [Microbacterium terrae]GLJ99533.1 hypothetical protein GCM10017594_27310 [Microbacterium terrae]